jgi:hypothetical protein
MKTTKLSDFKKIELLQRVSKSVYSSSADSMESSHEKLDTVSNLNSAPPSPLFKKKSGLIYKLAKALRKKVIEEYHLERKRIKNAVLEAKK